MALAPGLPVFVAGLLLYGFTAFVAAPLNSYVTAARGNWTVGRAITLISATFNAGMVIGPLTGGWLGDHFGLRTVYYIAGGLFVLSTIFLYFIAPQPRDHHDASSRPTSLLANRGYIGFLALGFVVILFNYLPQPFTSKFLQDVRQLSLAEIGLLGTIGAAGNTTLSILLGFLNARLGFLLGQVGVWMFTALLWQKTGYGWFALGYFLLGGFRATRALFTAQIRPLVHESQMGLAYGIAESIGALTTILAPVLAGFLYELDPVSIYPAAFVAVLLGFFLRIVFRS
jgi:predicted MFS family arabinose efflux permease